MEDKLNKVEKQMRETPAQLAVIRAHNMLNTLEPDLLKAGVTAEQIQATRQTAKERIIREYEERERQDPLLRIEEALKNAAGDLPDEQALAKIMSWVVEGECRGLVNDGRSPQNLEQRGEWRGEGVWHAVISVLYRQEDEGGKKLPVSLEFEERFLRNLGVLDENQSLLDFCNLPLPEYDPRGFGPQPKGPVRERDIGTIDNPHGGDVWITRLPTNIPGVEARVNASKLGWVAVSISPETLLKIQSPQR